ALGAELRFEAPVSGWRETADGVAVEAAGERWVVDRLVVAAGPWAGRLLADLGLPLAPERNVVHWFEPIGPPEQFQPDRFPIFIWDDAQRLYGLPDVRGDGVKVAFHHTGQVVDPDRVDRSVGDEEVARMRARLEESLPSVNGRLRGSGVCLYTNTPDEHFAVGIPAEHPRLAIAAGCSGHAFKFA